MGRDVSRETSTLRASSATEHQLEEFAELVRSLARPRGLVGFTEIEEEIRRSLLLLALVGFTGSLIDVGTGAGFPGIPLAICRPGVILVEPRRKAIAFLERVRRELKISVEIVPSTAETAASGQLRASADFVTARAVASLDVAAGLCAPLCRIGGKVLLTGAPDRASQVISISSLHPLSQLTLSDGLELSQRVHMMSRLS